MDFTGVDVLRTIVLCGLLGFMLFCLFYSAVVWRKRNGHRSSVWPIISLAVGIIGCAVTWGTDKFVSRDGIVDASNVFVVNNKRDMYLISTATGPVHAGDVVARFGSPANNDRIAIIDSKINEAKFKLATAKEQPLEFDPALLQAKQNNLSQTSQVRSFIFDLERSSRNLELQEIELRTTWINDKDRMDAEMVTAQQSLDATQQQLTVANVAMERAKSGLPILMFEDKTKNLIGLRLDVEKFSSLLTSTKHKQDAMQISYTKHMSSVTMQLSDILLSLAHLKDEQATLARRGQKIDNGLEQDKDRANLSFTSRAATLEQSIITLDKEKTKIITDAQVIAPFSGTVVYKNPAPGMAREGENTPVLAISTGTGFEARVWLPESDLVQIQNPAEAKFAIDTPLLNRYFGGTFESADHAEFEHDWVLAKFNVKLPIDAIGLFTSQSAIKVHLVWTPRFFSAPIIGSLLLILFGLFGLRFPWTRKFTQAIH